MFINMKMWKPLMMANNTHIDNQWPIKNNRPAVAAAAAAVPKQTYTHTHTSNKLGLTICGWTADW